MDSSAQQKSTQEAPQKPTPSTTKGMLEDLKSTLPQPGGANEALGKKGNSSVKTNATGARGRMKALLRGASERLNIKKETKEKLDEKNFFEKLFGQGSKAALFFTAITKKLGFGNENEMDFATFEEEVGAQDIEQFIVSHRALGYGREKENSKESIEKAIEGGEKELEIDLRKGTDGKLYLAHDSIRKETNPAEQFTSVEDALDVIAKSENQDITLFLDIKDPGMMTQLDNLIAVVDNRNSSRENYMPLSRRHFIMGYNPAIIKEAKDLNSNRPVIFNYIPTARLNNEDKIFSKMDKDDIKKVCKRVDTWAGTHLAKDVEETSIYYNGKELKGKEEAATPENVLHISSELPNINIGTPPQHILDVAEYVSIPAVLATKSLVEKLHNRGVKVAVFGAEGGDIQKAIAVLNVDLVISDRPDVIAGKRDVKPMDKLA